MKDLYFCTSTNTYVLKMNTHLSLNEKLFHNNLTVQNTYNIVKYIKYRGILYYLANIMFTMSVTVCDLSN